MVNYVEVVLGFIVLFTIGISLFYFLVEKDITKKLERKEHLMERAGKMLRNWCMDKKGIGAVKWC